MASATTRSDLQLPALTNFLSLAPTTSTCHSTDQRNQPSSVPGSSTVQTSSAEVSTSTAVVAEEEVDITTTGSPTNVGDGTDSKFRRSSSLSSDGSLKTFRFLRLGPVYHGGEHDGDWSEEVAVVE